MCFSARRLRQLMTFILPLILNGAVCHGSEWRGIDLPARPLNIVESSGTLWVCGADGLIVSSSDGGATWISKHLARNGPLLLTIGFASEQFGFAAGTGGEMLLSKDGGTTWSAAKVPADVIYEASFGDEQHGIIHTLHAIYFTKDSGTTWAPIPIDFSGEELKGFTHVLSVVALNSDQMAVVLSEGNSSVYAYKLFLTRDGGAKWTGLDIPNTGLGRLSAHGGEYWFTGFEVIEKDKPGGGYGVPLIMHSADAEKWTKLPRWSKHEFSTCNIQGCLYWDGAGVQLPLSGAPGFWTFPAAKDVTATWAVAKGTICSIGSGLKCAPVTTTQSMPPDVEDPSPVSPSVSAPPLNAPTSKGLQCLFCEFERIVVTSDFQGVAEVQLNLRIGQNGLVERADVVHATNAGIGEKLATTARTWIFVPFIKDGAAHPVTTEVRLQVQAIRSK